MLETIVSDLRFAVRMLRRSPLFTIVAIICISLGSGAVTTIFSAMNALVLRPLPGAADPGRLVRLERKRMGSDDGMSASYPFYEYLRDQSRTLDGVVAWSKASLTLRQGEEPGTAIYGNFVTGNLFTVLGVRPTLGRFFGPDEDRTELTHPVIVVSEGFWRSRLAADSGAVGREIMVNGHPFTLIGVAPAEFQGLDAPVTTDAWVPLHMQRQLRRTTDDLKGDALTNASVSWLRLGGRLNEGVSPDAAHRELVALTAALTADGGEPMEWRPYTDVRLSLLTGLPPDAKGPLAGFLGLLLGAAALVLLIASVNVAAMVAARAVARRREMAVRAALGAARSRLVRQLMAEILVLFTLGAVGGAGLALVATGVLERVPIPTDVPIVLDLSPDPRVFAFTLGVSLLMGVIVGLSPARRASRADITEQLRNGSVASSTRRSVMGNVLVVGQLSVSLVLLVGAGLFVRALRQGNGVDPGFSAAGVVTAPLNVESWGYDKARGRAFYRALGERVAATPGVTAVSYVTVLPLALQGSGTNIQLDGSAPNGTDDGVPVQLLQADADYFAVLRMPLVAGREFTRRDDERGARVAVVNETLATRYWPDGSALGRTFGFRGERVTVVGVARDAKYASLTEPTPAVVYVPLAQHWQAKQTLIVRTTSDPGTLARSIQEAVRSIDPGVPRPIVTTLPEAMGIALLPQRVAALVTGVLGAVGWLLATVGLYGIIAYSASRRMREIGIRLALGAQRTDVLRMVVSEGMRLTAVGVAVGLLLAAAAGRLLSGLLFGVSPLDAVTYVVMTATFVAVALLASWLPARRAAGANPTVVLRAE